MFSENNESEANAKITVEDILNNSLTSASPVSFVAKILGKKTKDKRRKK